jgi:hypothetical protein
VGAKPSNTGLRWQCERNAERSAPEQKRPNAHRQVRRHPRQKPQSVSGDKGVDINTGRMWIRLFIWTVQNDKRGQLQKKFKINQSETTPHPPPQSLRHPGKASSASVAAASVSFRPFWTPGTFHAICTHCMPLILDPFRFPTDCQRSACTVCTLLLTLTLCWLGLL